MAIFNQRSSPQPALPQSTDLSPQVLDQLAQILAQARLQTEEEILRASGRGGYSVGVGNRITSEGDVYGGRTPISSYSSADRGSGQFPPYIQDFIRQFNTGGQQAPPGQDIISVLGKIVGGRDFYPGRG